MGSLSKFLAENKHDRAWRGGTPCRTCAHKQARAINADMQEFAKAREDGHEMPWAVFYRKRLAPLYGLRLNMTAVMRHVRECLSIKA